MTAEECPTCGAAQGRPCRTGTGASRAPHKIGNAEAKRMRRRVLQKEWRQTVIDEFIPTKER